MSYNLEPCNRCCSSEVELIIDDSVKCLNCGMSELFEIWQLKGWRDILKYPPVHNGTIFIYGAEIGRTVAIWNKETQSCNNDKATHWLRTPDPRKQINMQSKKEES